MSLERNNTHPLEKATFSGGCFWCMQHDFDTIPGVVSTTVGYTGGTISQPTYEIVCLGTTGHVEAIEILFDPSLISYEHLLNFFWRHIDPTQSNGQFCDIGPQYMPKIFYHNEHQKKLAEDSLQHIKKEKSFPSIHVFIQEASPFYPAENYHQKYYEKSSFRYTWYTSGSGREKRLNQLWNGSSDQ